MWEGCEEVCSWNAWKDEKKELIKKEGLEEEASMVLKEQGAGWAGRKR